MNWRYLAVLSALLLGATGCSSVEKPLCLENEKECGGACVDLQSDPGHCGACDNACEPGSFCVAGSCQSSCTGGLAECGDRCVDTQKDVKNCGGCGKACGAGEACVAGKCTANCAEGYALCEGACRDLQTDREHCGACGEACNADQFCVAGECVLNCASGLDQCGEACRDLQTDRNHCGECDKACGLHELCVEGKCTLTCEGAVPDKCGEGAQAKCVNVLWDVANCGECGHACDEGEVCEAGACKGGCTAPAIACGGACVSTETNPAHCGACDNACIAPANAVAVCAQGQCAAACVADYADCNGDLNLAESDGCEVHLPADVNHCGACNAACPSYDRAASACVNGVCQMGSCQYGWGDCDSDPSTGCETELLSNPAHCGACGNACGEGVACGFGVCGGVPSDPVDCSVDTPAAGQLSPAPGAVDLGRRITLSFETNMALKTDAGTITVTGDKGTNLSFALPHAAVSFGAGDRLVTIDPGVAFASGETVTVTLSGLKDAACDKAVSAPTWTFQTVDCTGVVTQVSELTPADGSTTNVLDPVLSFVADRPLDPNVGTIALAGDKTTNLTFALPNSAVTFSNGNRTVTIVPGTSFPAGEKVTVSVTGLLDEACQTPAVVPASWTFTVVTPPCALGTGGLPSRYREVKTPNWGHTSVLYPYYMAADSDPNGYVWVGSYGSTTAGYRIYRVSKTTLEAEDVWTTAELAAEHIGYAMFIDGPNVYTMDSPTTQNTGVVFRLTSNGGATWEKTDMVEFFYVPGIQIRGGVGHGGKIYLMSFQSSTTGITTIYKADPASPKLPARADVELTFGDGKFYSCTNLAADKTYFYTSCRVTTAYGGDYAVVRIDRVTGATEAVARFPSGNTVNRAIFAADNDGDDVADYLFVEIQRGELYAICQPSGPAPYTQLIASWNTGTTTYGGMAYDPADGSLWAYNYTGRGLARFTTSNPGPGEAWDQALPLTGSGPITPNSTKRLDPPTCFSDDSNITWYKFVPTEKAIRIAGDQAAPMAILDANLQEVACLTDATQGFRTISTPRTWLIAVTSAQTNLTLENIVYNGVGPTATPAYTFSSDPGTIYAMVAGETAFYLNDSATSIVVAPRNGDEYYKKGSADGIAAAMLGYDLAKGPDGSLFSIDTATTAASNTAGRLFRLFNGLQFLNPPERWDVPAGSPSGAASTWPTSSTRNYSLTSDGSNLIIPQGSTTATYPVAFSTISVTEPGFPQSKGTATQVYYATGIAADSRYYYVGGYLSSTDKGVFRIDRENLSAPPVKLVPFGSTMSTSHVAIKLDSLTDPKYLYARDYNTNAVIHVVADPAGASPTYLGTLDVPVGTSSSSGMDFDFNEKALYYFVDETTDVIMKLQ